MPLTTFQLSSFLTLCSISLCDNLCYSSSDTKLIGRCFFFNDTATTEIYTLSLHDALPTSPYRAGTLAIVRTPGPGGIRRQRSGAITPRSEEHTSELQSHSDLVCRLLLEKKKKNKLTINSKKKKTKKQKQKI